MPRACRIDSGDLLHIVFISRLTWHTQKVYANKLQADDARSPLYIHIVHALAACVQPSDDTLFVKVVRVRAPWLL